MKNGRNQTPEKYDVIIVGCGSAGIFAALEIKESILKAVF